MIKILLMRYCAWRRDHWFAQWLKQKDRWMYKGRTKEFDKYYLWRNRWLKFHGYSEGDE